MRPILTDLVLDTNGYFGAPGNPGELHFRPLPPCRIADTRVDLPITSIRAGDTREFAFANVCGIPGSAKAYSVNVTVVPNGPLGYLTMWPSGSGRPFVSTLNSSLGRIVANAALVPAGLKEQSASTSPTKPTSSSMATATSSNHGPAQHHHPSRGPRGRSQCAILPPLQRQ